MLPRKSNAWYLAGLIKALYRRIRVISGLLNNTTWVVNEANGGLELGPLNRPHRSTTQVQKQTWWRTFLPNAHSGQRSEWREVQGELVDDDSARAQHNYEVTLK